MLKTLAVIYCNGLKKIVESLDDNEQLALNLERISVAHQIKGVTRKHLDVRFEN